MCNYNHPSWGINIDRRERNKVDGQRDSEGTYGYVCNVEFQKNGRYTKVMRGNIGEDIPKPQWCGLKETEKKKMNERCVELAKHCIGLDRKKPYTRHGKKFYRPYRNYYSTGKNFEDWELMVQAGYADQGNEKNQHGGYTYWLTRVGLDWLGEKLGIRIYDVED